MSPWFLNDKLSVDIKWWFIGWKIRFPGFSMCADGKAWNQWLCLSLVQPPSVDDHTPLHLVTFRSLGFSIFCVKLLVVGWIWLEKEKNSTGSNRSNTYLATKFILFAITHFCRWSYITWYWSIHYSDAQFHLKIMLLEKKHCTRTNFCKLIGTMKSVFLMHAHQKRRLRAFC